MSLRSDGTRNSRARPRPQYRAVSAQPDARDQEARAQLVQLVLQALGLPAVLFIMLALQGLDLGSSLAVSLVAFLFCSVVVTSRYLTAQALGNRGARELTRGLRFATALLSLSLPSSSD